MLLPTYRPFWSKNPYLMRCDNVVVAPLLNCDHLVRDVRNIKFNLMTQCEQTRWLVVVFMTKVMAKFSISTTANAIWRTRMRDGLLNSPPRLVSAHHQIIFHLSLSSRSAQNTKAIVREIGASGAIPLNEVKVG